MQNAKNSNDRNPKGHYTDKLEKHNVDIIANIRMSFDSTIEYIRKLAHNIDDVSNYKMFILCVNNALELLYKFMVFNRNEFMLYSSENRENIYKKYNQAKQGGYRNLEAFFKAEPLENTLHTISFTEACKILNYVYQIEDFDELFYERCIELAKARNSLTHYSAIIRKVDIISYCEIFRTSIEWFNQDIKEYYENSLSIILDEKQRKDFFYVIDGFELWSEIYTIKNNLIENEILEDDMCKDIMGFIIENSFNNLLGVNSRDYNEIEELFFKENKKKKKEHVTYFYQRYHMMLLADMIINRGVKAYQHDDAPEVMTRLDLSDSIYDLIKTKWNSEELKKHLNISSDIYNLYEHNYEYEEEYDGY
jgi:hypothetical protein